MMNFEEYAKALDLEAAKLPKLAEWKKQDETSPYQNPADFAQPLIDGLSNMLTFLGAKELYVYDWHSYCRCIEFKPMESRYFKKGNLLLHDCAKLKIDENLEGVIGVGFDEDLDYNDNPDPELVFWWYQDNQGVTDIELRHPTVWKDVLGEFFTLPRKSF
jgi:hypothetical protein